eukprot:8114189-Alexandrium_andersonii.AAC.1
MLLPPPAGLSLRAEIEVRMRLWQRGRLTELLTRVEEQVRERTTARRRARADRATARARRARALA